jgi:hypothetical protein
MPSVSPGFAKADHVYLTYLMLQRQLRHSNGALNLTASKLKPNTFHVWLRLVLYCEHVHILYDVCLLHEH